ncbi:MAG: TRAP transporter substrate-binding protein [Geminicoccaceae bacterium]|nr:MAG: TRAP transporter substrate-binding protein [Geminicoccaceae bacterium]
MRRSAYGLSLATAAAFFFTTTVPAEATIQIQAGTTNQPGAVQAISLEEFVNRVNARVGDAAHIEFFHSSQLGSDEEMLQKVRLGTQDISQPSTIMSSLVPEFGLFDLPYLVADREHMRCITEHIVWPMLAPKAEARGAKIIGVWENGIRHITNNVRPIVTPEDLRGIKLRTPQGVWRVRMFEAYGANPTPLAFSEVFVALQTGVMDGQENPYVNIYSGRFQEVQRYLTETRHVYTPSFPVVSVRRFNSYPAEVQEAILEEGRNLQPWVFEVAARLEEEVRDKLIAAGMEFNYADRDAFVAASQPVYDRFASEVPGGRELIDKALALADGC